MLSTAALLGTGLTLGALSSLGQLGTSLGLGLSGQSASEAAAKRQTEEAARQFDEALAWQREQYARTQKWQTEMLNTAHQREVEDLLAAGLNPVLSATGGSGAGSGSMSSPSSPGTTASAVSPDYVAAASMMSRSINSAVESGLRSVDTFARASAEEAKAAKDLAQASQASTLTPVMRNNLEKQAAAFSAASAHSLAQAHNLDALTPLQVQKLTEDVNNAVTSGAIGRQKLRLNEVQVRDKLLNSAIQRKFQQGLLRTQQVRAATGVVSATGDLLGRFFPRPSKFLELPRSSKSYVPDRGDPTAWDLMPPDFLK